jgi:hypothetical protein
VDSSEIRGQFSVPITCPSCGQVGHIAWEENTGMSFDGQMRALIRVSNGFHAKDVKTNSGEPEIICDVCETVQQD